MVVSTENPVNGERGDAVTPTIPKAIGLPAGDYRLVGWDLDMTGRRLCDEIVQVAAYTPENQFSQYVMPNCDLNIAARRRHQVKIVTVHRYRVLKHNKNTKPLKTKSEISSLTDFITWLENIKGDAKNGIILVCHEAVHSCPMLMLERLGKYPHTDLLQRFKAVVAGFANGFAIAERKCAETVNKFTLRTLSTVLLGKEEQLESAADRARLAYQVMQQVCSSEGPESSTGAGDSASLSPTQLVSCVREFSQPILREEELLAEQQVTVKKQDALRPVFHIMMRRNRKERESAFILRRHLVNANVDLDQLTEAWNAGQKEAISKLLETKVGITDNADRVSLIQMIEWHFVPELRPKPERRPPRLNKPRRYSKSDKTNGTSESGSKEKEATTPTAETPDSTTVSPKKEPKGETTPASPKKESKGETTPASPKKESKGETTPASPKKESKGETTPALPKKESKGEATPASPKKESKGETTAESPKKESKEERTTELTKKESKEETTTASPKKEPRSPKSPKSPKPQRSPRQSKKSESKGDATDSKEAVAC